MTTRIAARHQRDGVTQFAYRHPPLPTQMASRQGDSENAFVRSRITSVKIFLTSSRRRYASRLLNRVYLHGHDAPRNRRPRAPGGDVRRRAGFGRMVLADVRVRHRTGRSVGHHRRPVARQPVVGVATEFNVSYRSPDSIAPSSLRRLSIANREIGSKLIVGAPSSRPSCVRRRTDAGLDKGCLSLR